MQLNSETVLALAPDAASASAARGLSSPAKWPLLSYNDSAVWGECKGSGSKPYQTQVDLRTSPLAFRCSCPSRKFPCKHALALLLLRVQQAEAFSQDDAPAWVSEWLGKREAKEAQSHAKASAPRELPPEVVAAKAQQRAQQRWQRLETASAELDIWLQDRLQTGLGVLSIEHVADWRAFAARLVDAQAPGLAARVQEAAGIIQQGQDWPERLLVRLGRLHLFCQAMKRWHRLPVERQAELRSVAGWVFDKAEVQESGEAVDDDWTVLGIALEEVDTKLLERRVWLHGARSGRRALLLEYAHGGRGFADFWQPFTAFSGRLVFFPDGSLRAVLAERGAEAKVVLRAGAAEDEWQAHAETLAAQPWLTRFPLLAAHAIPIWRQQQATLCFGSSCLPLSLGDSAHWGLLALSGGHPVQVMGEWDGEVLHPLSAWGGEQFWQRSWA